MNPQLLLLIEPSGETRLDERTKAIGRAGLVRARQAIAEANQRRAIHDNEQRPHRPTAA